MKQLPEKVALDKAINGQRLYQGQIELCQMTRLVDMLADCEGVVEFSIQFERADRIPGKAQVKVKTNLPLICTISRKRYLMPVDIDSSIGFINDLAYEELLDVGMEASWFEDGYVNLPEIIEDELILIVPDVPFDETVTDGDDSDQQGDNNLPAEKENPFSVLESLKQDLK